MRFVIASRGLLYDKVILQREDDELTKRIYLAQKDDITPGDFAELVSKVFLSTNQLQDDRQIMMTNRDSYKLDIKAKVKTAAFNYLKEKQQHH